MNTFFLKRRLWIYNRKSILWILAGSIVILLFLIPLISDDSYDFVVNLIAQYPAVAPLTIIGFRFLAVVLAPLPGAPIAFASMAFLPWWEAFIYNFIGSTIGMIAAFFIARKFRERAVVYFTPLTRIHEWQERVSKKREFLTFLALRFTALSAFDFISYGAGLSKMPFRTFIVASLLIDIPTYIVFFYFGSIALKYSFYLLILFGAVFIFTGFILGRARERGKTKNQ